LFKQSNIPLQIIFPSKLHISIYLGHFNEPLNPDGFVTVLLFVGQVIEEEPTLTIICLLLLTHSIL
jgi:hypothetical protein